MEEPCTGSQSSSAALRRTSRARAATSVTVEVAGLPVELRSPCTDAVADLLGRLPVTAEPARLEIRSTPTTDLRAHRARRAPDLERAPVAVWFEPDRVVVASGEFAGVATAEAVTFTGDPAEARRLLPTLLAYSLAAHDRFVAHAAVVRRAGTTVMAVAPSGRGKSTVAWAAHRGGWEVLTDDTAVVRRDPTTGAVLVSGLPRTAWVPSGLGAVAVRTAGDHRSRVPVELAQGSPARRVDAVAAITWGTTGTGAVALAEPSDQMPRLCNAFLGHHHPRLLREWFPVASTLARGVSVELALGVDAGRRVADLDRLLGQIAVSAAPPISRHPT